MIFIFINLQFKHDLFSFPHRSRVDKEVTAGTVHALRLAHDLEPNRGRNLRASLRPSELRALTQGPILLDSTATIFYFMYFVHVFIPLYWYLKNANKRL